jgi:hypothetical protein
MATRNQNIDYVEVLPKCDTCDSLAKYEIITITGADIRQCEDCKSELKDEIDSCKEFVVREKKNRY